VFREYGLGVWTGLTTCYPPGTGTDDEHQNSDGDDMSGKEFHPISSKSDAVTDPARQELRRLLEAGLREPILPTMFNLLLAVQVELRLRQQELVSLLETGRMTPEAYLDRLNVELHNAMAKNRDILGSDRFEAVFGAAGYEPDGLIDRETFMSQA
jgi:hypothetical protein